MQLDVDITLKQGAFTLAASFTCAQSALGILGPSGCGKSTLFRVLAGLTTPTEGHAVLGDRILFDATRGINLPPHRRGIGLVFQDALLFPHWSVEKNLRAGDKVTARVAGRPYSFDEVVDLLEIRPLLAVPVIALSGGEQQRVAIGRTLLSNPRLLLMDEPVSGLDRSLKRQILPFLADIHRAFNIPAILISHDLTDILQFTDHILLLREGKVVAIDTLAQLQNCPAAQAALHDSHEEWPRHLPAMR